MSGKKNNLRNKVLIITAIIAAIPVLFLLNGELDSKIADHPKIVGMEKTQEYLKEGIDSILSKQEVLNDRMDWMILEMGKLLISEYP